MDKQTFTKLLDEALVSIKQDLSGVKSDLSEVKKDLSVVQKVLSEVKDTLDNRVLPSITETEMTLKSYGDRYKINQHNIERVDTRLSTVEEKLDLKPPEELKVPHFSSK